MKVTIRPYVVEGKRSPHDGARTGIYELDLYEGDEIVHVDTARHDHADASITVWVAEKEDSAS